MKYSFRALRCYVLVSAVVLRTAQCARSTNIQGLVTAVKSGDIESARKHLAAGIDVNTPVKGGSCLHTAVKSGRQNSVTYLLNQGAKINWNDEINGTPLHLAAVQGASEIARILLENGADVSLQGYDNYTALHWAAQEGHDRVCSLLIKHGADGFAQDKRGKTPLDVAKDDFKLEFRKMLIRRDVVDAESFLKQVDEAMEMERVAAPNPEEIARLQGSGLSIEDLMKTIEAQDVIGVNSALSKGVPLVHLKDRYGHTPLHKAVKVDNVQLRKKRVQLAGIFLHNGADVNAKSQVDGTPLHLAAVQGFTEMSIFLLERGADVNALGFDKYTPLHWACKQGNIKVVELLLKHGANPYAKETGGKSSIDIAPAYFKSELEAAIASSKHNYQQEAPLKPPSSSSSAIPAAVVNGEDSSFEIDKTENIDGVLTWTVDAVTKWLRTMKASQEVIQRAAEEQVDGATLVEMDKSDWKEIGASGIKATRLIARVKALQRA